MMMANNHRKNGKAIEDTKPECHKCGHQIGELNDCPCTEVDDIDMELYFDTQGG